VKQQLLESTQSIIGKEHFLSCHDVRRQLSSARRRVLSTYSSFGSTSSEKAYIRTTQPQRTYTSRKRKKGKRGIHVLSESETRAKTQDPSEEGCKEEKEGVRVRSAVVDFDPIHCS